MRLLVSRFYFRNLLWDFTFFGAEFWSLCLFWFLNSPGIDRLQGFFLQTFSHSRLPSISFICLRCFNLRFPLPFSLFNRILVFLSHLFLTKSWYCLHLCILARVFYHSPPSKFPQISPPGRSVWCHTLRLENTC